MISPASWRARQRSSALNSETTSFPRWAKIARLYSPQISRALWLARFAGLGRDFHLIAFRRNIIPEKNASLAIPNVALKQNFEGRGQRNRQDRSKQTSQHKGPEKNGYDNRHGVKTHSCAYDSGGGNQPIDLSDDQKKDDGNPKWMNPIIELRKGDKNRRNVANDIADIW